MTKIVFDTEILLTILIGAICIILGVSINNGSKQRGFESPVIGSILFVIGWIIVVYGLRQNPIAILGAISIIAAVMIKESNLSQNYKQLVAPLFIIGWLIVAYAAAGGIDLNIKTIMAVFAVIGVFTSMLLILPSERISKITDTIGMPIFTASWFLLAGAASLEAIII